MSSTPEKANDFIQKTFSIYAKKNIKDLNYFTFKKGLLYTGYGVFDRYEACVEVDFFGSKLYCSAASDPKGTIEQFVDRIIYYINKNSDNFSKLILDYENGTDISIKLGTFISLLISSKYAFLFGDYSYKPTDFFIDEISIFHPLKSLELANKLELTGVKQELIAV